MAKLMNLISDSLKEKVEMVVRRPKRRRIGQGIIASSNSEIEVKCKEIRWAEQQERNNNKCIPVLFMFGEPRKRLTKLEVNDYTSLGCRIEYMTQNEVKQLNLK